MLSTHKKKETITWKHPSTVNAQSIKHQLKHKVSITAP